MSPLLEQFITETRDLLEQISEKLLALEAEGQDGQEALIHEIFRFIHTLKGNSGLFEFRSLTRVVHAGEDLLDAVRSHEIPFSPEITDQLLVCMDFVSYLIDAIEKDEKEPKEAIPQAEELAKTLRGFVQQNQPEKTPHQEQVPLEDSGNYHKSLLSKEAHMLPTAIAQALALTHEADLMESWRGAVCEESVLTLITYEPEEECFYKGEDPFYQVLKIPKLLALGIEPRVPWPNLDEIDLFRCTLRFYILSQLPHEEIIDLFRYVPDQVAFRSISPRVLISVQGDRDEGPIYHDFADQTLLALGKKDLAAVHASIDTLLGLCAPTHWAASALRWLRQLLTNQGDSPDLLAIEILLTAFYTLETPQWETVDFHPAASEEEKTDHDSSTLQTTLGEEEQFLWKEILAVQKMILEFPIETESWPGRVSGICATLEALFSSLVHRDVIAPPRLQEALNQAITQYSATPVIRLIEQFCQNCDLHQLFSDHEAALTNPKSMLPDLPPPGLASAPSSEEDKTKSGKKTEERLSGGSGHILKVAQEKIDHLMELIGEMVVAKNSLPYLADRAYNIFGSRELSREIKNQYAVINRISNEMQDAIMQVRMLPVNSVLQRFPRLVRDLSKKLNKQVNLVIEGETTECDKNIIESLADPLVHVLRNSLDHGLETPEQRAQSGKPTIGTIKIKAYQEGDRVMIVVSDDGKGVDPIAVKHKAFMKHLISEEQLEALSDEEAIQMIFMPGFSTADTISDVSGRGVGMDAVRSAVEKNNGTVKFKSVLGQGTQLEISLPLSMAVTDIMLIRSGGQNYGIPMESVVETVLVPLKNINLIKHQKTTVLRERMVPLFNLNDLLGMENTSQIVNDEQECAVLVIKLLSHHVGLIVDDFQETLDIILKPMEGFLANLDIYAGTALLGDGSVLIVLNPKKLL